MKTITEIRKDNLIALSKNYRTQKEFADAIGMSPAQLGHLISGFRGVGEKLARKIESNLRMNAMILDVSSESNDSGNVLVNEVIKPIEVTTEELGFLNLLRDLSSIQRNKMREIAKEWKNENRVTLTELGEKHNRHAHA